MKRETKSVKTTRTLDSLISEFSENELLNIRTMSMVRGGDGEENGSVPIIIIPPLPGQTPAPVSMEKHFSTNILPLCGWNQIWFAIQKPIWPWIGEERFYKIQILKGPLFRMWFFLIFAKRDVMIIERTKNEIIFRLPYNVNVDDLQDLTDLLEYNEITKKSKATQKDVDILVKELKKGRWQKTKQQLDWWELL
jgi:hypothetical protein